ncbi:MAG: hypothetical protein J7K40_09350 [candidate division Zixibacteria bacterium]|nr:hypothetical protein [candidate division Zixibacteria bacterium]
MITVESATDIHKQRFEYKDQRYVIKNLISLASELPVQEMPLEHLNIFDLHPDIKSFRNWIGHIKSVLDADLDCPIILDDEGYVMDGRHRIAKAILEGKETIKFVRFRETPPPDYYEEL